MASAAADDAAPLDFALDRRAEVPLGVQLAWAIRSRIHDRRYPPGARLPGMRELADSLSVNVNTVRAVMQRLEHEGLIERRQGTGTFVAAASPAPSPAAEIAAIAALEAHTVGIDPREVAAALYVSEPGEPSADSEPVADPDRRRRLVCTQITALEQALAELGARFPTLAPEPRPAPYAARAPRLLSVEDLEDVRAELLRRLSALQEAIDALDHDTRLGARHPTGVERESGGERERAPVRGRAPRAKAPPRPAPAGA
ncbi:MAG: winged helix-turn-helix domain-containing protein [Solirubrobacterales bacterium]|nr:winged helix-turn-helix domain-containing protein [Solirubrobacterales bacterium]